MLITAVRRSRLLLLMVCGVAGALVLAACGGTSNSSASSSGGGKKVTLVYAGFGGDFGKAEEAAYLNPFMKLHPNIKVVYDDTVDFAKLKAMVESNNVTWDVFTGDLIEPDPAKYFDKLDCSQVPCSDIVKANNVNPYVSVYYSYADVLTYNKQTFSSGAPQTWADFFNTTKFPGKRALDNQAPYIDNLVIALLADGVAPDKIWPNLDIQRALNKLGTIKNDIVWYTSNQQCAQLVASGQASMGMCLNGRVYDAIKAGSTNLGVSWNTPLVGYGAVSIPKGSKHPKEAMELIAYMLNKDVNAKLSNYIDYGPTNKQAFGNVSSNVANQLPSAHSNGPVAQYDWLDFSKYGNTAVNDFQSWLQK